jgi:crotonobetainyl-CoA:carnitine CoA-transferase CaiB-like acyl-CoA transferase
MSGPLEGIRVVELASFVAAPAAGALLVDLGAEVIKVEVPWGEIYRHSTARLMGVDHDFAGSAPYQMDNHGKRSLALDLALPEAQAALKKVIDGADVLITNMLPARLAKNGLDPEELLAERPDLIVGRMSGYGADGPEADTPAFDYTAYWARSGLMQQLCDEGNTPGFQRPGIGDHSAGLALALGIVAALRTRDAGGGGQIVDVTLQSIGYYIAGNDMSWAAALGQSPPRHDRRRPRNPLWNQYPCKGGRWLFLVMIESDRYWAPFTEAIGRKDLAEDERFAGAVARFKNSEALVAELDATFAEHTLEEWAERLNGHRLIWAPVRTHAEAATDETAIARNLFPEVDHPDLGRFKTVAPPLRMSGHPMPGNAPAPGLGADTAAVLAEAGVDDDTIALLVASAS